MFVVYSHPDIPRLSPTMMGFRTERGQLHSHRCSDILLRNLSWRPPGAPRSCSDVTPAGPYAAGLLAGLLPPLTGRGVGEQILLLNEWI